MTFSRNRIFQQSVIFSGITDCFFLGVGDECRVDSCERSFEFGGSDSDEKGDVGFFTHGFFGNDSLRSAFSFESVALGSGFGLRNELCSVARRAFKNSRQRRVSVFEHRICDCGCRRLFLLRRKDFGGADLRALRNLCRRFPRFKVIYIVILSEAKNLIAEMFRIRST